MSSDSSNIFDSALSLSVPERASLAYQLLQSLRPPDIASDADADFDEKLARRVADYEAGRTTASDWDDVAARLQAKLSGEFGSRPKASNATL